MSDVDAIVLDLDGGEMLLECIESLWAQTLPPARIIVLDNGSRVPVSQRLDTAGVTLLRSETNLGFAAGVNLASRYAEEPYVALVNNDVVLDDDWLATLRAAMEERDGAIQTAIRRDLSTLDGAGIDVSDGTIRQAGSGSPVTSPQAPAWGVSATAALYRRNLLHFDERFFAYYEDVELCARLHEAGWSTRVLPLVKATHRGSASAGRLGRRARYLRTRNRYFVARLHPEAARVPALLGEDVRLLLRGRSSLRGIIAGLMERVSG